MEAKDCVGCGAIHADRFENEVFEAMCEKLREFQVLTGDAKEPLQNPKQAALQSELSQVEAEIAKLVESIVSANSVLLSYINSKVQELDTRKQAILAELAKMSTEQVIDGEQIGKISHYLGKWEELSIDDKRLVCDFLIEVIHASSEKIQIHWRF